jgi:hypothetical protein
VKRPPAKRQRRDGEESSLLPALNGAAVDVDIAMELGPLVPADPATDVKDVRAGADPPSREGEI